MARKLLREGSILAEVQVMRAHCVCRDNAVLQNGVCYSLDQSYVSEV